MHKVSTVSTLSTPITIPLPVGTPSIQYKYGPVHMKQIQLSLTPSPGANPEFLATVEPLEIVPQWDQQLPSKINLEGYTRDAWAWKPSRDNWIELVCVSVDGRNKLPGFIKYLKERQKCSYGRFSPSAVWVVSYIQKGAASANEMRIRLCFDITKLEACPLAKSLSSKPAVSSSHSVPIVHQNNKAQLPTLSVAKPSTESSSSSSSSSVKSRSKSGLLGNLLGATKRTNQHMEHSAKSKPVKSNASASTTVPEAEVRTAQLVLNEFRQKMEEEMLDFDSCSEVVMKVNIVLSEMQRGLNDADKARITMEVLRYIVFEAAEECNEEWVAHKEPSEFMDECVIAVYKDGHAPEEVLEEANRVELTEDMRGEQFAILETNRRKQAAEEAKRDEENFKKAIREREEEEIAVLNTNKRDRRTIEEIQLGVGQPEKKRRQ